MWMRVFLWPSTCISNDIFNPIQPSKIRVQKEKKILRHCLSDKRRSLKTDWEVLTTTGHPTVNGIPNTGFKVITR